MSNIILTTDSYKVSHYRQYPPGAQTVYSYFESRGGRFEEVVFFGLQYILKKYLQGIVVNSEKIWEAKTILEDHLGPGSFNSEGWKYILEKHAGRLPVRIKAVPDGTVVPTGNVLMTVENTDPNVPWLTNYLETILSQVWYPSTVATQSREMKRTILGFLEDTGDPAGVDFKLHDFGYRGSTSDESAGIGGAAHLVNFKGTDTLAALQMIIKFYGRKWNEMPGFSIPAAEHSTITSWGKDNEVKAYENMLDQYPSGLVAVVSDSYDIYNACNELWGGVLKDKVLARDGTLVIRPDSGDPVEVVVNVLDILGDKFGYILNEKGYRVLPPQVRVIQGDGIDSFAIEEILSEMEFAGWSADNVAFGSGGGLLQKVNRDTCKFAFKCSAIEVNGEWKDVYKDPITMQSKKSKRGRLGLIHIDDVDVGSSYYTTIDETTMKQTGMTDELVTVFENGAVLKDWTFGEVRERAKL